MTILALLCSLCYHKCSAQWVTLLFTIMGDTNLQKQLKKAKRTSPDQTDDSSRTFLISILEALLKKMKWDEDADPNDMDDDDKQAFESLRRVRKNFPSLAECRT